VDHVRRERNEPGMHPWCTQAAPPGSTAAVDRPHGEARAVIVVGQWTGQEASALRYALRLTIRDFAEHLGVAERTVAKWEAGGSAMVPVLVMQAALDTVLERASDEAKGRFGMLLGATWNPAGSAGSAVSSPGDVPGEREGNMERRAALASMAAVLGATLLEFTGALRHSNVGERMLGYIEGDAARFATQYAHVSPGELLSPVQDTVTVVQKYLDGRQPIEHRRRLCRAAAQLATVAGMTLFNLHNEQQARWAFRAAAEAAAEAEDGLLGAWVAASECMIPTYNNDPWEVLMVTQRGQCLAAGAGSAVVAKLAALEAKAHASLGNDGTARNALAAANRAMTRATAEELQPGVFGFSPAKYFFYEGTCHVRLGQPDAALEASQQALALYQPTKAFMEPTIARIDMAMAHANKGDLDQACQLTRQAAAIPADLRTGPIMARVHEFFAGLEPRHRGLPAVQEVREQLALPRPTQTDGA
jgi:tetratricopeptide (TPR) repeat protein